MRKHGRVRLGTDQNGVLTEAQSPEAQSPEAQSPEAQSPEAQSHRRLPFARP